MALRAAPLLSIMMFLTSDRYGPLALSVGPLLEDKAIRSCETGVGFHDADRGAGIPRSPPGAARHQSDIVRRKKPRKMPGLEFTGD
jgi:hypothetical protein